MHTFLWTLFSLYTLTLCGLLAQLVTRTFRTPTPNAVAVAVIVRFSMVVWIVVLLVRGY